MTSRFTARAEALLVPLVACSPLLAVHAQSAPTTPEDEYEKLANVDTVNIANIPPTPEGINVPANSNVAVAIGWPFSNYATSYRLEYTRDGPKGGEGKKERFTVYWNASSGATRDELVSIQTNSVTNFGNVTCYVVESRISPYLTKYSYRPQACNDQGCSAWSGNFSG